MKAIKKRIGVDVGGSHVAASVIDMLNNETTVEIHHKALDSSDSAQNILRSIGNCINDLLKNENQIESIGIAFPGPFDYEKGVSAIAGVGGKFSATFGIHIGQALKNICQSTIPFRFFNDAHCFAVGANKRYNIKGRRKIFLTLGTGFGSAFIEDNNLIEHHANIPLSGTFFDQPFLNSIADDYFSTRWILNEYKTIAGKEIDSVKKLAQSQTVIADSIFAQFGRNLGAFLLPWIQQFDCDEIVVGGNIAKAYTLFGPSLFASLMQLPKNVSITYSNSTEECILFGAAHLAGENRNESEFDKLALMNIEPVFPVHIDSVNNQVYNVSTFFHSDSHVYRGFNSIAEHLSNESTIIIDGAYGVQWDIFREQLNREFLGMKKNVFWYDISSCLKSSAEIEHIIETNINYIGLLSEKIYKGTLLDFFSMDKLELLRIDPSADICIVYGTGASLSNWKGSLVFVDLPKCELKLRVSKGYAGNINAHELSNEQMDQRFSLVDWPIMSEYKSQLLTKIDFIVDEQRIHEITWMIGNDFRDTLANMLKQPFGKRPKFGSAISEKDNSNLNEFSNATEDKNKDWSFDFVNPDSGIVIEGNEYLLGVSFEFLPSYKIKKLASSPVY